MIGFKLVRVRHSGLMSFLSFLSSLSYFELNVCYKPGVWVEPKLRGSKLFAFDTYEAVLAFKAREGLGSDCEIWVCDIINAKPLCSRSSLLGSAGFTRYWCGNSSGNSSSGGIAVPCGTIGCDAIKLKEIRTE